jgi:hypothetical protein
MRLKSDRFLTLGDLIPLLGNASSEVFYQNWRTGGFPQRFLLDTMVGCITSEGTHHAPVHTFAQARFQLVAGAAAHVSPRHHLVFCWLLVCQAIYQEKVSVKGLARLASCHIAE